MKKVKLTFITIATVFLIYNIIWFSWRQLKYNKYSAEFDEFRKYMSYTNSTDEYDYNVKYPDYLSYTGNLGIVDKKNNIALIIWPLFSGDYKYGIIINDGAQSAQINAKIRNGCFTAEEEYYNDMLIKHKDNLLLMKEKSEKTWNIVLQ